MAVSFPAASEVSWPGWNLPAWEDQGAVKNPDPLQDCSGLFFLDEQAHAIHLLASSLQLRYSHLFQTFLMFGEVNACLWPELICSSSPPPAPELGHRFESMMGSAPPPPGVPEASAKKAEKRGGCEGRTVMVRVSGAQLPTSVELLPTPCEMRQTD